MFTASLRRSSPLRSLVALMLVAACSSDGSDPDDDVSPSDESVTEPRDARPDREEARDAAPGDDADEPDEPEPARDAGVKLDGAADARVRDARGDEDAAIREAEDASEPDDASGGEDAGEEPTDAMTPSDDAGPVDPGPSSCPSALVGWASVAGDGVTTTSGGSGAPVRPKTAEELQRFASDPTPRIIEIAGTFSVPRLEVASNKTLLGIGKDATLRGGVRIRGKKSEPVSNVVLRNLRIDGATTDVDDDAVQLYFAHHVWIDHCEIWDGPDGNLDMTHAVNWVTVSWTKIRYTENYKRPSGESGDHRFASLVGHSDNNSSEDTGRLKISFHHNWWAERVIERMPRVRFGEVHVFNNYFASAGNNYCVRAGRGARVLIEGNYFDGVKSPHEFNNAEDQKTAHITARANVYQNTSGTQATGGGGTPFERAPYAVTIEPAQGIAARVRACAGPR